MSETKEVKETTNELTYIFIERPFESIVQLYFNEDIVGSLSVRDSKLLEMINDKSRNELTFTKHNL